MNVILTKTLYKIIICFVNKIETPGGAGEPMANF